MSSSSECKAKAKRGESDNHSSNQRYYQAKKQKREAAERDRALSEARARVLEGGEFDLAKVRRECNLETLLAPFVTEVIHSVGKLKSAYEANAPTVAHLNQSLVDALADERLALSKERSLRTDAEKQKKEYMDAHAMVLDQNRRLKLELDAASEERTTSDAKWKAEVEAARKEIDATQQQLRRFECNEEHLQVKSFVKLEELRRDLHARAMKVDDMIMRQREVRQRCQICQTSVHDTNDDVLRLISPCGHVLCVECVAKTNRCGVCKALIRNLVSPRDMI